MRYTTWFLTSLLCLGGVLQAAPAAPTPPVTQAPTTSVNTLSPRLREAFVQQIATEQYSSNLYLSFSSYFADIGLEGCEKYFLASSKEEAEHARRFYDLLIDRNERVQLNAVEAITVMPASPLDAFKKLVENEKKVSRAIYNLYTLAIEDKDYASQAFLDPFLLLQVEEEKETQDLLALIEMGPTDPAFILGFDERLRESLED